MKSFSEGPAKRRKLSASIFDGTVCCFVISLKSGCFLFSPKTFSTRRNILQSVPVFRGFSVFPLKTPTPFSILGCSCNTIWMNYFFVLRGGRKCFVFEVCLVGFSFEKVKKGFLGFSSFIPIFRQKQHYGFSF